MKIAQVISSCAPGGAEMLVKDLSKELVKLGQEVEVWVLTKVQDIFPNNGKLAEFEKSFVNELQRAGISVRFVEKRPRKDRIETMKKLRTFFNEFRPDIVHSHLEDVTFHVCVSLSRKVPIVQTIHSTVILHPYIQKFYLRNSVRAYIGISSKVSNLISSSLRVQRSKIFTIYNGIELSRFQCNRKIGQEVRNLISVGNFKQAKGYPTLFKSIVILKQRLIREGIEIPKLSVVGGGELEKELKELVVDYSIEDVVEFLGVREDIPELLASNDIYVMASHWEGLSMSLIEALASGIPIVATDAGSNSEIVENGISGIIVPIKNPVALAEALFQLISNYELRQKFSMNAVESSKRFSIQTCVEKHLELYQDILSGCISRNT